MSAYRDIKAYENWMCTNKINIKHEIELEKLIFT